MGHEIVLGGVMETLSWEQDAVFDAVVCDPPYGLSQHSQAEVASCLAAWSQGQAYAPKANGGFMGAAWDSWVPGPEVWREVLRVLKPGGHALVFAGTRSMDLMAIALRLAGFELRDAIGHAHDGGGAPLVAWTYGSGFPKSLDAEKALDKAGNPLSQRWHGYGTALKPAWEPVLLARKPLEGTVAQNVLAWGTGAINVDGCRVAGEPWKARTDTGLGSVKFFTQGETQVIEKVPHDVGRWPANVVHDGSAPVLDLFPETNSRGHSPSERGRGGLGCDGHRGQAGLTERTFDTGSAARFFYCAKPSSRERGEGNIHPTVKPIALATYLAKLLLPPARPDGTPRRMLVPFAGSGSEVIGALAAGWDEVVGIEREPEYVQIAINRILDYLALTGDSSVLAEEARLCPAGIA